MASQLGIDVFSAGLLAQGIATMAERKLTQAREERAAHSQGREGNPSGCADAIDIVDVLHRMALLLEVPEDAGEPTCWIDVAAPLELVEATVKVRDALADSAFGKFDTCCWEATGALGLCARQLGYPAEWQPCNATGGFHMLLRSGRWAFDPTAEQYGVAGPQVFDLAGDWPWPILELNPDEDKVGLLEPPEIPLLSEAGLVSKLARWVRAGKNPLPHGWEYGPDTAIPALLVAANLEHLGDEIYKIADEEVRAVEANQ